MSPDEIDVILTDEQLDQAEVAELDDFLKEQIPLLLIEREDLFRQHSKKLDPRFFSGHEGAALTIAAMLDLYEETGRAPTKAAIKSRVLQRLTVNDAYEPVLEYLKRNIDPRDAQVVVNGLQEWVRVAARETAQYEIIELSDLDDDEFFERAPEILKRMDEARRPPGARWSTTATIERPTENDNKIPLPWPEINARLQGGLVPTETIGFIAPTQGGKSLLFGWLIAHFMDNGFNVLHVDIENEPHEDIVDIWNAVTQPRPGSHITYEVARKNLHAFQEQEGKGRYFNTRPGETDYLGPNEIHDIANAIEEQEGIKIHVILIDGYDDLFDEELLKRHRNDEIAMKSRIIDRLRKNASDKKRLTITSYQTNRVGLNAFSNGKSIEMDMVQGSIRTIQRNTMVWTFTPDYKTKISRLTVKKARRGGLNGCTITANYHHTTTEDNDRGYYTQRAFVPSIAAVTEDAMEKWSKSATRAKIHKMLKHQSPEFLPGSIKRKDTSRNKSAKWGGHIVIPKVTLQDQLGELAQAAVEDMVQEGWIIDPEQYAKGISIEGQNTKVYIFRSDREEAEDVLQPAL